MKRSFTLLLVLATLAAAAPDVLAQANGRARIAPGDLTCLPLEDNAAITAAVAGQPGGTEVRLYFRRLNPEGAYYYVEMLPSSLSELWTVFPKPQNREQAELTDEWWDELRTRDWMAGHDREWLEDWLEEQELEASEYYVGIFGPDGRPVAVSDTRLVEVQDRDECEVTLTREERGWAENMTVGETVAEQIGAPVYHWLCDGIVTRIGWNDVYRPDDICRRCIIVWWDKPEAILPAAVLLGGGVVITEASPSRP